MKYAFCMCLSLCAAGSQLVSEPALAEADANSAAHALAQKFIDGPARDAREDKRRSNVRRSDARRSARPTAKPRDPVVEPLPIPDRRTTSAIEQRRRNELDSLSSRLRQARTARRARPDQTGVQVLPPPKQAKSPSDLRTAERPGASEAPIEVAPRQRRAPWPELRKAEKPRTLQKPTHTLPLPGPATTPAALRRVAVLLVMRPSARSSRRFHRTADPVICVGDRCYVSTGADQDARVMSRRRTLGPGNSLSRRAGACRRSPSCIFRDVDLGQGAAWLQPIDLGWLRHDRRRPTEVAGDPTCKVAAGRLSCDWTVEARDYRLWVVPEVIARKAGAEVLRKALASGLRANDQHADARGPLISISRTN